MSEESLPEIEIRGAGPEGAIEPFTTGLPLPRGALQDCIHIALQPAAHPQVPAQAEALERWSDGSVRWALLDFVAAHPTPSRFHVVTDASASTRPVTVVAVTGAEGTFFVDTGVARIQVAREGPFPFRSVVAAGREVIDPAHTGLQATDAGGRRFDAVVREATLERAGPIRATLALEGGFEGAAAPPLVFFAWLDFFAGLAVAKITLTVRNPRRAAHPRGIWELGDAGSVLLTDLSLALGCAGASSASWSAEPDRPLARSGGDVEIYQESSGGENWRSAVHRTRAGTVPMTFRGYRVRAGDETFTGSRSTPRIAVHDGSSGISVSIRNFWQNFPMALEASPGVVRARLFPAQFPALHELQGGEQKTHEISVAFGEDALGPALEVFRAPSVATPTPETFARSGALPYLLRAADDPNASRPRAVAAALDGSDTFAAKRERFDEYGWRNFGEMPADHESRGWSGEETFVSHYNNQYDAVQGALIQFAGSGDLRWYRLMDELARHVADIDIYHTVEDRPWYNRGLFWPTAHYTDAGLSTHRTYPRGSGGGGPDNEHNYTTGLRWWWLLTGNRLGLDSALDVARRAIAADDGASTRFRWLDRGPTGFASMTRGFDYHGPGRGAANSIVALLDAWASTADEKWLLACDDLVRRTIHPLDDVAAHDLLDAENRWSYTVHLQAIGRYLDDRAEAARVDEMYAYARESLLSYARWMVEHERPTLDRPEQLEFPTETWAAQDLRKVDVLCFAALHSEGDERSKFLERARTFLDLSLRSLETFPTRTYTRPLVLVARFGAMAAWLERYPHDARPAPRPGASFGPREPFVPQRARAIRRARDVVLTAAAAGAGFALARLLG